MSNVKEQNIRVTKSENNFKKSVCAVILATIGMMAVFTVHAQNTNQNKSQDVAAGTVFQAAGNNGASIQGTIEQFRNAIGGNNNGANPPAQPLTTGRREINWDGGGSTATSVSTSPLDVFLVGRGARFTTPGTGLIQAPVQGLADTFGNPSYATIFKAFSPVRLFSPIDSNITDTLFFQPGGGEIAATTRAFGAIFSDVDLPDGGDDPNPKQGNRRSSTLIEFFAANGDLIFSSFAPASPGDGNFSFFGVVFEDAVIARVRITTGAVPGVDDSAKRDVVMMDDFIYGEPQRIH